MIALAQILRNESFMLHFQLEALAKRFPLCVALDFGSTDGTQDILTKHGVNWAPAEWPNSYAEARNMVMDRAWGLGADAVFFLDGDEMIFPSELKLEEMERWVWPHYLPRVNLSAGRKWHDQSWPDYQPRFILKATGHKYSGCVHESLCGPFPPTPSLATLPVLYHYNHYKSAAFMHLKCQNYDRLLKGQGTDWTLPVPHDVAIPDQGVPYKAPIPFEELFSSDWFTPHTETMEPFLAEFKNKPCSILEIGCYEGRSTSWFLKNFSLATIQTMDTFEGAAEHKEIGINYNGVKERFWFNVDRWRDRVSLFHGSSVGYFSRTEAWTKKHDIVFVDGSHTAADVLCDLHFVYNATNKGGIIVCDDYEWDRHENRLLNPRMGIDAFLECYAGSIEILHKGYRVIVKKK